jgi:hypothetical protein
MYNTFNQLFLSPDCAACSGIGVRHHRNPQEQLHLSQADVAKLLNKPQWYVSRCENGLRRIDVLEILEFSVIYNKKIEYFFSDIKSVSQS